MKREEANGDLIRPGDVYEYSCCNDQGYGYMIPVKTSGGWDFIDTYQLGIPWSKDGETSDDASIRRIIELGHGEHDGYVSNQTSMFYHRNAYFGKAAVPRGLRLAFNLNDYNRRHAVNARTTTTATSRITFRFTGSSTTVGTPAGLSDCASSEKVRRRIASTSSVAYWEKPPARLSRLMLGARPPF